MVERPDGERLLLAPSPQVADLVAATYRFDRVVLTPVAVTGEPTDAADAALAAGSGNVAEAAAGRGRLPDWHVVAGPLEARLVVGPRTSLGHVLRAVPRRVATSRHLTAVTDPVARVLLRGVRTRGSAGPGRVEHYGATDVHALVAAETTWDGEPLGDLRDVVRVLRADPEDVEGAPAPQPTLDDVDRLVAEAREAGGDVAYERSGAADVPRTVEVAAFRVAQEGLTNARRHAPGSPVVLRVAARAGEVRVTVSDAGPRRVAVGGAVGGAVAEGTGTGLVGLRERVALLGGTLDAGARDDGFVLDVRLPWDA